MYTQIYAETIDVTAPLTVGLWNHQELLGDRLAMTAFVRDLKATYPHWKLYVDVLKPDVWEHNPHIDGLICGDEPPVKFDAAWQVGPFAATQGSKVNGVHFMRAFAYGWTRKTGLPIHAGPLKADIHLSDAERAFAPIAGDYWVVNPDTNNMGAKRWHPDRWREVFRSLPGIRFVQVGLGRHAAADYGDEPNVTSLVDRTAERELFALVARSAGCIGLISSLMHVAAAFDKPCVVLAGAREPQTFEQYPAHQFIHRVGTIDCARDAACWKNSITACRSRVETPHGPIARCMLTISVGDVKRAVETYYEGGRLAAPQTEICNPESKTIRIVTNGKCFGGAERSCVAIARQFHVKGWQVEIATRQPMCEPMAKSLRSVAVVTDRVSDPCDILLWYASDQVFDAHRPEFEPLAKAAQSAGRTVMALTYKLGKVPELDWCRGWDAYVFLSTALEQGFRTQSAERGLRNAELKTIVLAPPVDLTGFYTIDPDYSLPVRVVRHSSQGDSKWPAETVDLVRACPNAAFRFMPAPSFLGPEPNVVSIPHGEMAVPDFLAEGGVFLYLLPAGYTDQGPRVIVEAMAAGLPVICERRDGAADRVTGDTGWFVNNWQEAAEVLNHVTPELLAVKGRAAKARARTEFDPTKWYTAIAGE